MLVEIRFDPEKDPAGEGLLGYVETWACPGHGYVIVRRYRNTGDLELRATFTRASDYELVIKPLIARRFETDHIAERITDPDRTESGRRALAKQIRGILERGRCKKRIDVRWP
jgi:hypothetical protein